MPVPGVVSNDGKAQPVHDKSDVSNVDIFKELVNAFEPLNGEYALDMAAVGINNREVTRSGKRINKHDLLTILDRARWSTRLKEMHLGGLVVEHLRTAEGELVHNVKVGSRELACKFWGVDFEVVRGQARETRAMILPQVLTGIVFPAHYMYVYAELSTMTVSKDVRWDDRDDLPVQTPPGVEPHPETEGYMHEFYPETVYEHPDKSTRVIPAGRYTREERLQQTEREVSLLEAAISAAAALKLRDGDVVEE